MCCETHDLRDFMARFDGRDGALAQLLAPGEDWRCRCTELGKWPGQRCERKADGEDVLCSWCRATDHQAWYLRELSEQPAAVQAYYARHGVPGYAQAYPAYPPQDLAVSPQGLAEAEGGFNPEPYIRNGRIERLELHSPPFTFSPDEIASMRAAEGDSPLARGLQDYRLDLAMPEASGSGVIGYLQRKYGV